MNRDDEDDESDDQTDQKNALNDDEDESEYDPFAAETFNDPDMQNCWLILGVLYYHFEVTDFLEPVTEEMLGTEFYEDYCNTVKYPMDISTVMNKMRN